MRWIYRHPDVAAAIVLLVTIVLTTVLRPALAPDFEARADEVRERVGAITDQVVRKVVVNFTSDPSGATLFVDGEPQGTTPVSVLVSQGRPIPIRVVAEEPYETHDLFKPFEGMISAARPENNISVWLNRTSAEEQAEMQAAWQAEQERIAREQLRQVAAPENFTIVDFSAEWNAAGVLWVEGTVRNDGLVAAGVELQATATTDDGEVVNAVHFWPASVVNIPPGGTQRARYPVATDPRAAHVDLIVSQAKQW